MLTDWATTRHVLSGKRGNRRLLVVEEFIAMISKVVSPYKVTLKQAKDRCNSNAEAHD